MNTQKYIVFEIHLIRFRFLAFENSIRLTSPPSLLSAKVRVELLGKSGLES